MLILIFGCTSNQGSQDDTHNTDSLLVEETSKPIVVDIESPETEISPCDGEIVLEIYKNQNSINEQMVTRLLLTFHQSCSNNVEFGEFSNEMLFKVLEKRPDLFLTVYKNNIAVIDTAILNSQLASPIHDLIPLKQIIDTIDSLDFDPETKAIISRQLDKGKWF